MTTLSPSKRKHKERNIYRLRGKEKDEKRRVREGLNRRRAGIEECSEASEKPASSRRPALA
jgi:hypothetical protein